ncbi:TetR/AcrR family transcriptional regulator [Fervidibacillus halotolerans]|uniref:TetR/AcrR family transcriptional regulator n=1 Tax=Fervidibacillus halotolerans TaxID=2980027 RepID=A0A9E8M0F5_9BACI|nr:TetR/AcrR family transcriptional regulator [Fervidibacillus halotolerans]WAA12039.1 TetR/AcrR family transcriptional regulator [Fervidibacillus halotolerans]
MTVDRKKQVIEAAGQSFSMFGYKGTTIDQIAKLANVGKGTIYTYFKNKEELLQHIMQQLIIEMKNEAEKTVEEGLSFYEKVHRAIYKMLEYRMTHQLAIKLFEEAKFGAPEVVEAQNHFEEAIVSYIAKQIEKAIADGEIRSCDPRITAFVILKIYIALIFDWEKKNPPLSKEKLSELLDLYIFRGLAIRE